MAKLQILTLVQGLRATPPMQPKAKDKHHECPTYGPATGSPNVEPKLDRSRLNLGLPWMLTLGGPLLWRTYNPQMPFKESRSMADRRITFYMPRVRHSIGVGWLKVEPGDCQTFGGAFKQAWLEWRASKQARLEWPCRWRSKTRAIACHGHEVETTRICEDGLSLDHHILVLDRIPATNDHLAKTCHV